MLKDKFKTTAQDKKEEDVNGFWLIPDNPMTKIGVFPYLGRQISPELEPDRIYQVLRPEEELARPETLESLKLIPLINDHTMIGTQAGMKPAEEVGVEGTTGTNVKVSEPLLTNDLKCYTENIKKLISSGKKALSMGYRCRYELTSGEFEGQHYDAIQRDIIFNHIALVDEGRMGSDVRVMDSFTFDSITELTKNKENDMADEEKQETQAQDVDKREILREADAIAMKPASEFEGGEEEKFRTLTKKLEELSYNPSEAGGNDEEPEEPEPDKEGEDEEPPAEEPKKDDKPAEDEDPKKPCGDEDGEDPKKDEEAAMDSAVRYFAKRDELIAKIRPVIGDNSKYHSMTTKEITKYACDKLDIKNSIDALEGYLKAESRKATVRVSLDAAFSTAPKLSPFLQDYSK